MPAMIAADRKPHDASIQRRERMAHSFDVASFETIAPIAKAKGTDIPTYPRYSSGGWTAIRMWFCRSVLGPGPSVGTGNTGRKGSAGPTSSIAKKAETASSVIAAYGTKFPGRR